MEEFTLLELQTIEFSLQSIPSHEGAQELRKKFSDAIRSRTKGAHNLQAADFVGAAPSHS